MPMSEEASLVVEGGMVITLDQERRVFETGYVLVKDGRIAEVGPGASRTRAKSRIDATNMLVLPGIVNTHGHLDQSIYRSCLDGAARPRPLLQQMASTLDRHQARAAARLTLLEQVHYGITTTQASHWTHTDPESTDGICEAVVDSGMRAVVARSIMTGSDLDARNSGKVPDALRERVDVVIKDLDRLEKQFESTHVRIAPEAVTMLWCTADAVLAMRDWALRRGKLWHVHLAQDKEELADALEAFGCGSVQYAHGLGVLGPEMVAAHSCALHDGELDLLGRNGVRIAHCPATIMRAGGQVPPIWELERLGSVVGIGTDGSATNNGQNPWEAMKNAVYMQRVRFGDRHLGSAEQALEMATVKAAMVLGLDNELGSLETGKWADMAIFCRNQTHLMPGVKLINNLVFSGGSNLAHTVVVGGRIVLEGGRSAVFDEDEVLRSAEEAQKDLLSKSGLLEQLDLSRRWPLITPV